MPKTKWAILSSEDWWSVWLGLAIFALSLGVLGGHDLLGWAAKANPRLSLSASIKPTTAQYASLPGLASAVLTYLFLLAVCSLGAHFLGANIKITLGASIQGSVGPQAHQERTE